MTVREIECTLKWSNSRVTRTETEKLGNEGTNSKNWTIGRFIVDFAERQRQKLRAFHATISENSNAVAIPYATVLFNTADCGLYRKTC